MINRPALVQLTLSCPEEGNRDSFFLATQITGAEITVVLISAPCVDFTAGYQIWLTGHSAGDDLVTTGDDMLTTGDVHVAQYALIVNHWTVELLTPGAGFF